jgi:predicted outer membrane repeat protein
MEDSSANAYSMTAFGLYLADGTLFGVYGQPTTILTKTAASIALLACDIVFAAAVASSITFGATTFNNPPASTTTMGVVQLATLAQAQAGVDAADVLTPATAIGAVVNWIAGKAVNLGTILRAGFQVWDAGNDGAGSGLDADLFHGHTPDQMIASYFSAGSNANGYWTKRPDGNGAALIEQWGSGGAIYSEGEITIAFPVPFTNLASIHVDAIAINASGAGTRDIWPQLATKTLTGATFMMQWDGISSTTPTLDGFQFAAKGY